MPCRIEMTLSSLNDAGPRLHHQLPEERDAVRVWEGEQEEGADRQPGRYLQTHRARASDISRRFPQSEEDAGVRADEGDLKHFFFFFTIDR